MYKEKLHSITRAGLTLSLKGAAALLEVSPDTLKRAHYAGELKLFRLGVGTKRGKLYVKRAALEAWLDMREALGGAQ